MIFYVLPSADPAALRAGRDADPGTRSRRSVTSSGSTEPLPTQYYNYIKALVLHFDFGNSYINDEPVARLIFDRLPNTLSLVLGAAIIWFTDRRHRSASSPRSAAGRCSTACAWAARCSLISAPVYWLGLVVLYLFAERHRRVPALPGLGAYSDATGFFEVSTS